MTNAIGVRQRETLCEDRNDHDGREQDEDERGAMHGLRLRSRVPHADNVATARCPRVAPRSERDALMEVWPVVSFGRRCKALLRLAAAVLLFDPSFISNASAAPLSKAQQQKQDQLKSAAPADMYFGRMKLSFLGINNTFKDAAITASPYSTNSSITNKVDFGIEALNEWANKYPRDSHLSRSYFLGEEAFKKIWIRAYQDKAWSYMQLLVTKYPTTFFGEDGEERTFQRLHETLFRGRRAVRPGALADGPAGHDDGSQGLQGRSADAGLRRTGESVGCRRNRSRCAGIGISECFTTGRPDVARKSRRATRDAAERSAVAFAPGNRLRRRRLPPFAVWHGYDRMGVAGGGRHVRSWSWG